MNYSMVLVLLFVLMSRTSFAETQWRTPAEDNLVYLELESGTVVIELAPFMAPKHVSQCKK